MKIIGFYTAEGERIVARSLAEDRQYSFTRVVAGGGKTPMLAAEISELKQELLMEAEYVEDGIKVIPAVLVAASASKSYSFTEIGVYGGFTGEDAVLLRVYTLSEPVFIDNTSTHTLKLYLKDIDVADDKGVVIVSPDGILTESNFYNLSANLLTTTQDTQSINCTWKALGGVIDSIVNPVDKHYKIKITDAVGTLPINIVGKIGRGSITIDGAHGTGVGFLKNSTHSGALHIEGCNLSQINVESVSFDGAGYYEDAKISILNNGGQVMLWSCMIESLSTENWAMKAHESNVYLKYVFFKNSPKYLKIKRCNKLQILAAAVTGKSNNHPLFYATDANAANEIVYEQSTIISYNHNSHITNTAKIADVVNINQGTNGEVFVKLFSEAII